MSTIKIKCGAPYGATHYLKLENGYYSETVYFKKTRKGFLVYNGISKQWQKSTYEEQFLEAL